uniref:Uncharacterized protein n=1 Tax=Ditylenchus dipsaci TaxID=166011 RepID=A0A915DPZ3_9BILA
MMHGEKAITKNGNPKAAPMSVYLQWIIDAWESLPKEPVQNSFKSCAISTATDGSEDDQIHCFKPNGPVPGGRSKLKQAREDKELAELLKEIDLEQESYEYDSDVSLEY